MLNPNTISISCAGPSLWSARDPDGHLLGFGRSRGEARRAAVMASPALPCASDCADDAGEKSSA